MSSPSPASAEPPAGPPLRALFQRRVDGDDALLRLARLRFAQAGLAAEVYADTHEQLEWILGFAPSRPWPPVVHLGRQLNLLHERDRAAVEGFAARFGGRVAGLVVHDKAEMAARTGELVAGLRELGGRLGRRPDGPTLFLEYAAGLELGWFVELAERLRDLPRVGACVDVGHVGIAQARASFARTHPGLDLAAIHPGDARLPELAAAVQAAVATALPAVLELTRSLGRLGKPLHVHLHDGHPLIPGLSDHFSFLTRVPVPFDHHGRRSLDPLYGPAGLAAIVDAAADAGGAGASLTLEIHQAEGRRPLGDAAGLFGHWRDLTNAERMNHWLAVLAENATLVTCAPQPRASPEPPQRPS
jgi:sugar phosphate isomerase/epimerase